MKSSSMIGKYGAVPGTKHSVLDRWCRRTVFALLERLTQGSVVIEDGNERRTFGRRAATFDVGATIAVHSPAMFRRVAFGGSTAAGEAYADGLWSCDDLVSLMRIFARNTAVFDRADRGWSRLGRLGNAVAHWLRKNTARGSRHNIAAHYDLGNDFFSLFLDPTMSYSCAYFEHADQTLEEASVVKNDRVCRKLELDRHDHLIEIGTGWGSLAMHAATRYGCRVTTTTISEQQYQLALRRIRDAGLDDRVTVLNKDYRALSGRFNKLVSIEMVEAVGHQYFDTFLHTCSELLSDDGLMLLQAITMPDHRYECARRSVDFIKRFIFPGSCIPSVARLAQGCASSTDLRIVELEDMTAHYAITMRRWRENFMNNVAAVKALGYPDRFLRMWEYYLAYCEGGFLERYIGDVQMMFAKPRHRSAPLWLSTPESGT